MPGWCGELVGLYDRCAAPMAFGQAMALPCAGAMGDQPSWLMTAFDIIAAKRAELRTEEQGGD